MRRGLGVVGVALVVMAAACGTNAVGGSGVRSRGDKNVLLTADDAVLTVGTASGDTRRFDHGLASADRSTVVSAVTSPTATTVNAEDASSGRVRWSATVDGEFAVRVVARDGRQAALAPGTTSTEYAMNGRTTTTLLVVWAKSQRRFDLVGNFEPEAFTTDGHALVVIEYLPAAAPDRYTIRLLDLGTGAVTKIPDHEGEERQPMRGTARTSVMSPDGKRLYTYYAAPSGTLVHGVRFPAFVHVLDLEGRWAHCVGLASPFGTNDVGIGISRNGATVFVADAKAGVIAELDTRGIGVRRISRVAPRPSIPGVAPSVAVGNTAIFVGAGRSVQGYDRRWLTVTAAWTASASVQGVRLDGTERSLFAALPQTVVALRPRHLTFVRRFTLPDALGVRSADPATRPFDGARDEFKCAC